MKQTTLAISLALIMFGATARINPARPMVKPVEPGLQDSAPTLDVVLEKYIQALGGRVAIESVTSRVMKGEVQEPVDYWSYEAYWKSPNKYLQITHSTGESGLTKIGTNGTIVWFQNNDGDVRENKLQNASRITRDADLQGDLKLKQYFPNMLLKGKRKVGDRETYCVESKTSEGFSDNWYFDTETGLLFEYDYERKFGDRKMTFEYRYKDYKKVDGVMIPFTIERNSPSPYTHRWKEVKNNIHLDDAIFEKPAVKR